MLSIRFLTGPLAGKIFKLQPGRNTIGRSPQCDIRLPDNNVSKEHSCIEVFEDKIIVSDSGSRNGTFVNGIQIKSHKLKKGDKIGFYDSMAVVGNFKIKSEQTAQRGHAPMREPGPAQPMYDGNLAYNQNADHQQAHNPSLAGSTQPQINNLWAYFIKYLDEVVLPGIYKLPEWMEYKHVLMLFVGVFIVLVTSLSTIPLIRILRSSIEQEAQNRALTIARALSRDNRSAIMNDQATLISVENARTEPGVNQAYVISSAKGEILAPPQLVGQYITNVPQVNEARKFSEESVIQVDSDTIAAIAPIKFYNQNTGVNSVTAHSVVIYNMGALAVSDEKTLSLFVQVLFIATLAGGLLFFFLYKLILRPIVALNESVDKALRGEKDQVSTIYQFPELHTLATNINSAISRRGGDFAGDHLQVVEPDRTQEIQNLTNLVGFPAITISMPDRIVFFCNEHFLSQIGAGTDWSSLAVDKILDQALKLNIHGLLDRVSSNPSILVNDQLEIANQNYDISAQGLLGAKSLSHVLVVFIPKIGGDA